MLDSLTGIRGLAGDPIGRTTQMGRRVAIAMFVDACGWEVVQPRPWFLDTFVHRRCLRSLFGFSSACVPAILTGRSPSENGHWSSFFYSPETSPFRHLRHLKALPPSLLNRGRARRYLSKLIARVYGYTGYFQIYNLPFDLLPYYDYGEKKDIFRPGGINSGTGIFDDLVRCGISHHVSNWRRSEQENFDALGEALDRGEIAFGFVYAAELDGLMHRHTKDSPVVDDKLRRLQREVENLTRIASGRYDEVRVAVFSDHGMATVRRVVDWIPTVEAAGLRSGEDYAAVYDSTMMRFWFLAPHAEQRIRHVLPDGENGRWVTSEDLVAYGTHWPDGRYGHAIYALEPGVLLNPSHIGTVPFRGMHGYRPDHPDSDAALLSNFELGMTSPPEAITDLYGVMREMASWASDGSARPAVPQGEVLPA
jgi:hypothetical protein